MTRAAESQGIERIPQPPMECVFSVDVEDWFHILGLPSTPDVERWKALPSTVEKNFMELMDLFSSEETKVTCFFLGWVAERFPHLVREAVRRGHEPASHGYAHRLVYGMAPADFRRDIRKAKEIVEEAAGRPVLGYRCPGFSVTDATPWFFEEVVRAGYRYDSSVFPAPRAHGGMDGGGVAPYWIQTLAGPLFEFPITVARVLGRPLCFFGGGYLRLYPYAVVREMGRRVIRENRPVLFYVHPREIDPSQPRLSMSAIRRFKSYVGLRGTRAKVKRILKDFRLTTFQDYLARRAPAGAAIP